MSKITLAPNASGTGTLTIAAPNTNTNRTLTLPDTTTTFVGTDATQTLTNKTLGSGLVMSASAITSGTSVSATGTSVDFTGIPSWVKRITVMFNGVSTSGTSRIVVRLGDSGGVETTGYFCVYHADNTADARGTAAITDGFHIAAPPSSSDLIYSQLIISLVASTSNTWVGSSVTAIDSATDTSNYAAGGKSTSETVDRVRITTVNGTDTFDAGTINILYE